MWLTTNSVDQPPISGIENIISNIGRCVVCEKPAPILVRHNFSSTPPKCPDGWKELWTGYGFMGGYLATGYESGQKLGDPGACLETYMPIPFIQCSSPNQCDYFTADDFAMWLTGVKDNENIAWSFGNNPVWGIDNLKGITGRCVVCSK